jgi:hypothetical protein
LRRRYQPPAMKSRTADSIAAGLFARANEQSGCAVIAHQLFFFATLQPCSQSATTALCSRAPLIYVINIAWLGRNLRRSSRCSPPPLPPPGLTPPSERAVRVQTIRLASTRHTKRPVPRSQAPPAPPPPRSASPPSWPEALRAPSWWLLGASSAASTRCAPVYSHLPRRLACARAGFHLCCASTSRQTQPSRRPEMMKSKSHIGGVARASMPAAGEAAEQRE